MTRSCEKCGIAKLTVSDIVWCGSCVDAYIRADGLDPDEIGRNGIDAVLQAAYEQGRQVGSDGMKQEYELGVSVGYVRGLAEGFIGSATQSKCEYERGVAHEREAVLHHMEKRRSAALKPNESGMSLIRNLGKYDELSLTILDIRSGLHINSEPNEAKEKQK